MKFLRVIVFVAVAVAYIIAYPMADTSNFKITPRSIGGLIVASREYGALKARQNATKTNSASLINVTKDPKTKTQDDTKTRDNSCCVM